MVNSKYAIFDKMIEGVQVIAPDYTYLYVNETVANQGKYHKDELLNHTMMEKYPGIEKTDMFKLIQKCMDDGGNYQLVNEFDFPDGSKGYFELRMQEVEDGVIIFSYDITDVRRAQKLIEDSKQELEVMMQERSLELQESEERFQLAVAGTSAGVWDWKVEDGNKEWWSPKFYELLGYKEGEIRSSLSGFNEILHPDDYEYTLEKLDAHLKKRIKFELEYRLKTKSGEYKWFLGNGQATWDADGKPIRMVGTIIDIDDAKKAQELLKKRSLELERKNGELKEFVYVASHDLQEPVRTIASFINLFVENYNDKVDDEGKKMLEFMKGATERSQNLIVDLLDYSRLGTNKKMETIPLEELLGEVEDDLSARIKEKQAEIIHLKLPKVYGLRTELRLLFQNLIANALKFNKPGTPPQVSIKTLQQNGYWQFAIEDNGIGFNPDYKEKIFVVFSRLNNRKDYEGTGIGLAQCKRIVELHGGEIWAESEVGNGSTFYFTIPVNESVN